MKNFKLSPSALNLFVECPRCFWLQINKNIRRPRGIYPSLPGGMDLMIKKYFDKYRAKNQLPPELVNKVSGVLFPDIKTLEGWRSWKNTGLYYKNKSLDAILSGAIDDCLIDNDRYIVLDYKTRGAAVKDDPRKYYQLQLDCYSLMLDVSGYPTKGVAYLIYYWPVEVKEHGLIQFHVEPIRLKTDVESAKETFRKAVILLSDDKIPEAGTNCEYCNSLFQIRNNPH